MAISNIVLKFNGKNGQFDLTKCSILSSTSLASLASSDGTVSVPKSGWYPLGVLSWKLDGSGSTHVTVYKLYISNRKSGSATLSYGIRSIIKSTATINEFSAWILWVKE